MKYEYHGDFDQLDPPGYALRWLKGYDRVLELGPAGGALTTRLAESGSSVVTVEFDPSFLPTLSEVADVVLQRDLDAITGDELGQHGPFDAVVATDVLEHLRDPSRMLEIVEPLLRDDGLLVVSLPNVAHGDVRLALLSGEFNATDQGLLDGTHLRYFTRDTAEDLLASHGFEIVEVQRTRHEVGTTEQAKFCDPKFAHMRETIAQEPEADTYQFIFRAVKRGKPIASALRAAVTARQETAAAERLIAELRLEIDRLREIVEATRDERDVAETERVRLAGRVRTLEDGIKAVGGSGTYRLAARLSKLRNTAGGGSDGLDATVRALLEED